MIFYKCNISGLNRISVHFGAIFGYGEALPGTSVPGPEPPGSEAYFFPGHLRNIDEKDNVMQKMVAQEAAIVTSWLSKVVMPKGTYESIIQVLFFLSMMVISK